MEITKEIAEKIGLNEDQIKNLNEHITEEEKTLRAELNKKASDDAQGILGSVASGLAEMTGAQRERGERHEDYIKRASKSYVDTQFKEEKKQLEEQKRQLEEKIKAGGGDATIKAELEAAKEKLSKFDEVKAEIENQYKTTLEQEQSEKMKYMHMYAIDSEKPKFPDTVNPYEAKAKWDEFVKNLKEKYDITIDSEGNKIAKDKENEFKIHKISDLIAKDESIQSLLKGRENTGLGSKDKGDPKKLDGVPFEVLESDSKAEIRKKIETYLTTEKKLSNVSSDYAKQFSELWSKINA